MAIKEPRYYGSWKGRVIKAIVIDGIRDWKGLQESTELSPKSLNRAIAELRQIGILTQDEDKKYRVSREVWKEYKSFFGSQESIEEGLMKTTSRGNEGIGKIVSSISQAKPKEVSSWVNEWKKVNNLDISIESDHFYLEGGHLDNLSKGLIQNAKKEILVVNPFVDECSLTNTLLDASKNRIKIVLITRPVAEGDKYREEKKGYHDELIQSGIKLTHNRRVHAKLIVVDREIAIISSMNLNVTSSGGSSWEAGIVSMDETVVKSVIDSILNLLPDHQD
jgi:phosphatidylserine/phosphatidylglycerophosphate/cardiolipin synthase-like enzyme